MSTLDALIERTRRDALLASRGPYFTLASGVGTNATLLTLNESFTQIGIGEMLSIDYELFYVQGTNAAAKTVTVIPHWLGSSTATHSTNALVEIAPRFPKAALADWAKAEIQGWGKRLWRTTARDIGVTMNVNTYDLGTTGDVDFLLDVRMKPVGTDLTWWNWSWVNTRWAHAECRLLRQMNTTEFASGFGLQFMRPLMKSTTARVAVAQPFNFASFDGTTDLVATTGLRAEWEQIVEAGIKWRALTSTAIGRSDWRSANVARTAEEVTPTDTLNMASSLRTQRQLWLTDAMTDLRSEFPFRKN